MAAPVELFTTSILSNHKVRARHERYTSVLSVKKVPFVYHDLASDEDAKNRWRRKAKDPQIPGLLVHNEWRGTFEEFEEAVEFGELDLFLRIDPARAEREAAAFRATSASPNDADVSTVSVASTAEGEAATTSKSSSHKIPAAPSVRLVMAPAGSGKRADTSIDDLFADLGLDDVTLSDADASALIEEADASRSSIRSDVGEAKTTSSSLLGSRIDPKDSRPDTSPRSLRGPPARTYVPSPDAGTKPLRLARMGSAEPSPRAHERQASGSLSPANHARYSASQRSTKALAAEAEALATTRKVSASSVRTALASGQDLQDALGTAASRDAGLVGREDADELFASLGLGDVDMTEEEAEAFLNDGKIPEGLHAQGERLQSAGRAGSKADKARNEIAAREVARKAREAGYLPRASLEHRKAASVDQKKVEAASVAVPTVVEDEAGEKGTEAAAPAVEAAAEKATTGDTIIAPALQETEPEAEKGDVAESKTIDEAPSTAESATEEAQVQNTSGPEETSAPLAAVAEPIKGDTTEEHQSATEPAAEEAPAVPIVQSEPAKNATPETTEVSEQLNGKEESAADEAEAKEVPVAQEETLAPTSPALQVAAVESKPPSAETPRSPHVPLADAPSPVTPRSPPAPLVAASPTADEEEDDLASLMATAAIASGDAPAPPPIESPKGASPHAGPSTPPRTSITSPSSDPTLTASPVLVAEGSRTSNGGSTGRTSSASLRSSTSKSGARSREVSSSSAGGRPSLGALKPHSGNMKDEVVSPSRRALDYKRPELKDVDYGPVSPPLHSASSSSWSDAGDAPKRKRVLDGVKSFVGKSKEQREREKSHSSQASAASSTATSRSGHQRTISDILREADAAMSGELEEDEGDGEGGEGDGDWGAELGVEARP